MPLRLPQLRSTAVRALAVLALAAAPLTALSTANASDVPHGAVVSDNPADHTPRLVPSGAIGHPHVDAIGQAANGLVFAGGLFDTVADANGNNPQARQNGVIFDGTTGVISPLRIDFNKPVWAVETNGNDVWMGGEFTTVNGVSKPRLVKLNATTGQVVSTFGAGLKNGRVQDIEYYPGGPLSATPVLIISGSFPGLLLAIDPDTGKNTGKINLNVNTEVPGAFGSVAVNHFSASPDGTRLFAVGNFMKVGTADRPRAFMANLANGRATLSPWYYPPFEKACGSTTARRLAYLSDVDFAPDGSWFVIVATGWNPNTRDDWGTMVCDAAARFNTSDLSPDEPVWINYTGGDTIWSVTVTGAAVYVQGHFQYLNNIYGVNNTHDPNSGWVTRKGVGAINPTTGRALDWNPSKPAKMGGKDFLATADGLWIVSDSAKISGEPRYGIAFMPLV